MPLTAEEKKIRKQEKKARKKEEAENRRIKTRKDELSREVEMSISTRMAHGKRWYKDSYVAHWPLVRQDMEVAWKSAEHTIDYKNFIIAHLADTMDEVKLQEAMSWQDFTLKLDDSIERFTKKVDNLSSKFNDQSTKKLDQALQETVLESCDQVALQDFYKTILFIMEEKFQEESNAEQGEYMTKRDEEGKKETHNIEAMSAALENSLQITVAEIRDTLVEYKTSTEARKKEVEVLRAKDSYYMDMIQRQDLRMAKLWEELNSLQSQENEKRDSRLILEDLKKDREETYTEYTEVRAKLSRDSHLDDTQLLTLTCQSNDVLQNLHRILDKGKNILRLGALCRKLETQEEKVSPFGAFVDYKKDKRVLLDPFSLFWRRHARVNLIKRKLELTLKVLQSENEELKDRLQSTLEIMAMIR